MGEEETYENSKQNSLNSQTSLSNPRGFGGNDVCQRVHENCVIRGHVARCVPISTV